MQGEGTQSGEIKENRLYDYIFVHYSFRYVDQIIIT